MTTLRTFTSKIILSAVSLMCISASASVSYDSPEETLSIPDKLNIVKSLQAQVQIAEQNLAGAENTLHRKVTLYKLNKALNALSALSTAGNGVLLFVDEKTAAYEARINDAALKAVRHEQNVQVRQTIVEKARNDIAKYKVLRARLVKTFIGSLIGVAATTAIDQTRDHQILVSKNEVARLWLIAEGLNDTLNRVSTNLEAIGQIDSSNPEEVRVN